MKTKIFLVMLSIILLISFISMVNAEEPIYGKNGMLVYKDHIIKKVCYPFMPCGVTRIDTPIHNKNNQNKATGTSCKKDTGFFRIFSPTYDPATDSDTSCNQGRNFPSKTMDNKGNIKTLVCHNNSPTPTLKHFANTDNTQKNFDSKGNWIENKNNNNRNKEDFYVFIR